MKYEDNRSALDLLKKMFRKFHKHGDKVQVGSDQTRRIMGEIYMTLSDEQKKHYEAWEEVQIFILQMEKEKNQ